MKKTVKIEQ